MKIKIWPDVPFWDELVKKSPESTFFHTHLWHEIVAETYRDYSIATRGFEFDDGTRAIFPLIQTKAGGMLKGQGTFEIFCLWRLWRDNC